MFENCQNFQDFFEIFKEPRADVKLSAQRLFRNTSKSRLLGSTSLVITIHKQGDVFGASKGI